MTSNGLFNSLPLGATRLELDHSSIELLKKASVYYSASLNNRRHTPVR
jgi:hypothetical protein